MLTYDVAPAVFDAVAPGVVVAVKTGDRIPTSGPPYAYGTARYEPPAVFTALVDQPCERMFCVGGRLPAIGDPRRGASIPCDSCFDGTAPVVLRTHCDQQCDVYPCKRTDANCSGGYRSLSVKVACVPIVDSRAVLRVVRPSSLLARAIRSMVVGGTSGCRKAASAQTVAANSAHSTSLCSATRPTGSPSRTGRSSPWR